MLEITSLRKVEPEKYDEVWAIVRTLKTKDKRVQQVIELAPRQDLYYEYFRLKNSGKWNEEAFKEIYVPQFINDVKKYKDSVFPVLNKLYLLDKEGKNIALACYCSDEETCHRSIIAGLLQSKGIDVKTEKNKDYSVFGKLLQGSTTPI